MSGGVSRGVLVGVGRVESLVSERAVEGLRRWGEGISMSGRCRLEPLSAESATELADMSGVGLATKLLQGQALDNQTAWHSRLCTLDLKSAQNSSLQCNSQYFDSESHLQSRKETNSLQERLPDFPCYYFAHCAQLATI